MIRNEALEAAILDNYDNYFNWHIWLKQRNQAIALIFAHENKNRYFIKIARASDI